MTAEIPGPDPRSDFILFSRNQTQSALGITHHFTEIETDRIFPIRPLVRQQLHGIGHTGNVPSPIHGISSIKTLKVRIVQQILGPADENCHRDQ